MLLELTGRKAHVGGLRSLIINSIASGVLALDTLRLELWGRSQYFGCRGEICKNPKDYQRRRRRFIHILTLRCKSMGIVRD